MLFRFFLSPPLIRGGLVCDGDFVQLIVTFFSLQSFFTMNPVLSPLVRPCKSALLTSLRYPILPQIIRHSSLMQLQPDYWASLVRVMHVGMACFPGKVLALLQDFNHLTWEVLVPSGLERLGQRLD